MSLNVKVLWVHTRGREGEERDGVEIGSDFGTFWQVAEVTVQGLALRARQ